MKRSLAFSLGMFAALGIFFVLLNPKMREEFQIPLPDTIPEVAEDSRDPILVIVVGSKQGVAHVRSAIPSHRIVAESEGAFATVEERIVAASPEAASGPLNAMHWVDREIQIVRVPTSSRPARSGAGGSAGPGGADAGNIAELMQKDTLTSAEANQLLLHMEARGDF